jgi:nicotinamide phosphoribosyltransferase
MTNIILLSDSYKASHKNFYPKGTQFVHSYLESRGGKFPQTTFFGLQYVLKKYLTGKVVTKEKISQAEKIIKAHGLPFNREGWEYILSKHGGKLPIVINAIPEGTSCDVSNALLTIENTDTNCYWLTNYLESILLQTLWYGTTVATLSRECKKLIKKYLVDTGGIEGLDFKLHDFGFRGVSSVESSIVGGMAHLVNFKGTDTMPALTRIMDFYNEDEVVGFSIPATEHSTITSWGESRECAAFENVLDTYPEGLVACVSDSYDIERACRDYWGTTLRDKVLARKGTLVVRPDSGPVVETLLKVLTILGEKFGTTTNQQGYKELPPQVRVIQGDGINFESIGEILEAVKTAGFSTGNLAMGMGGALLQGVNRDTQKFAIKCSSVTVNFLEKDVSKSPVGQADKKSKAGKQKLITTHGGFKTVKATEPGENYLKKVFCDGELLIDEKFSVIRSRAAV